MLGSASLSGGTPFRVGSLRHRPSVRNGSFFGDLNMLRRQARNAAVLKQAAGSTPEVLRRQGSAEILNPAFNVWATGNYADFSSKQAGADRDGRSIALAAGAYMAPSTRFMLGLMYRYRDAESSSVAQNSNIDTRGNGVGIYSTVVLTPTLSFSSQALYERSRNDIRRGTSSGDFDADQYVISGALQGSFWRGPFWLRPTVGATFGHVDQHSYIDSAGDRIGGQITRFGQLTFGPRVGHRKWFKGGSVKFVEVSATAIGVWNFIDGGDTTLASGTVIHSDGLSAQLGGGVSVLFANDAQVSVRVGYAGFGASRVNSISFSAQVSIPFGGK